MTIRKIISLSYLLIFSLLTASTKEEFNFRKANWDMTISEVMEQETLIFSRLHDESEPLKILAYDYPTPLSSEAEVYYFFPQQNEYALSSAGYIYYLEDYNDRSSLVEKLAAITAQFYGAGNEMNNSNFEGYSWTLPDRTLAIFNDLGAQAVQQIYFDNTGFQLLE